jgi:hypothetical protein
LDNETNKIDEFLSYLLGKPADSVEPDYVEIHEKQLRSTERGLDINADIAALLG